MGRARTLITDDDAGMRLVARTLAEEAGCAVVAEARDGAEAVERAAELRPDLVIMDIHMPGLDGIEATRRIKESHPETVVIGWSSTPEPQFVERMLEAGAAVLLPKDDPARVVQALRDA